METSFKNNTIELAEHYDYFILDIWGVIHDGSSAYPNVTNRIKELIKLNKKICFLSNAPRRSSKVAVVLEKYGITSEMYDFIMTSGEATYLFLENNQQQNFNKFPQKYFYVGPDKDIDLLDGLQYEIVQNPADAGFILCTGFDNELSTLEEKLPQLQAAIKYQLPMICVNPDLIVVKQTGLEMLCAGILALEYKKMGGEVIYFGKPYNLVYDQVFQLFSLKNKTKVLAVGDGIETDILGASNNKIDSALIGGGILSNRLNIKYGQLPDKNKIKEIFEEYKTYPNFVIAGL